MACWLALSPAAAQDSTALRKEYYQLDAESRLEIEVHIWGEVNKPGISLAGGPTQYAAMSWVKLTHQLKAEPRVLTINMDRYLDSPNRDSLPLLLPGDGVRVPRNTRFYWRDVVSIIANLATIVNFYMLIEKL